MGRIGSDPQASYVPPMDRRGVAKFVCLTLAALLVVTSQAFAVAQGKPAAVGTMVICQGNHMVTVAIDADGQPVETVHLCPDHAVFVAGGGAAPNLSVAIDLVPVEFASLEALSETYKASPVYWGRGPPVLI